ncbi:hypothetical protein J6590_074182 [Homalodisca vitripennis]|nr:hypothetical protein J6590_074182 [Homalodisca vitripennis]
MHPCLKPLPSKLVVTLSLVHTPLSEPGSAQQKPMCHLNLGNLMDVQVRHITNHNRPDSGVQGLNKGVPPPACFDWRGRFRGGLPFIRGDMTLRCSSLILLHGSR